MVDQSHPSWVRGLKHEVFLSCEKVRYVAPLVGAWIETTLNIVISLLIIVAPLVGAWIET